MLLGGCWLLVVGYGLWVMGYGLSVWRAEIYG